MLGGSVSELATTKYARKGFAAGRDVMKDGVPIDFTDSSIGFRRKIKDYSDSRAVKGS